MLHVWQAKWLVVVLQKFECTKVRHLVCMIEWILQWLALTAVIVTASMVVFVEEIVLVTITLMEGVFRVCNITRTRTTGRITISISSGSTNIVRRGMKLDLKLSGCCHFGRYCLRNLMVTAVGSCWWNTGRVTSRRRMNTFGWCGIWSTHTGSSRRTSNVTGRRCCNFSTERRFAIWSEGSLRRDWRGTFIATISNLTRHGNWRCESCCFYHKFWLDNNFSRRLIVRMMGRVGSRWVTFLWNGWQRDVRLNFGIPSRKVLIGKSFDSSCSLLSRCLWTTRFFRRSVQETLFNRNGRLRRRTHHWEKDWK